MATEDQPELLTPLELEVMDRTAELVNMVSRVMGGGRARSGDWDEFVFYVHGIQRMILKQAAARAYPGRFRLLGEDLDHDVPQPGPVDVAKVSGHLDVSVQGAQSLGLIVDPDPGPGWE